MPILTDLKTTMVLVDCALVLMRCVTEVALKLGFKESGDILEKIRFVALDSRVFEFGNMEA
jgi:hypothetical protein